MQITTNPGTDLGIPEPKWESIHPHTKTGSPNRFGACSVTNQKRFGVHSNLGTNLCHPQIGTTLKTGTPYWNGDPQIGMGRDLSIFQIGESQKQYGVHSNLGIDIYTASTKWLGVVITQDNWPVALVSRDSLARNQ